MVKARIAPSASVALGVLVFGSAQRALSRRSDAAQQIETDLDRLAPRGNAECGLAGLSPNCRIFVGAERHLSRTALDYKTMKVVDPATGFVGVVSYGRSGGVLAEDELARREGLSGSVFPRAMMSESDEAILQSLPDTQVGQFKALINLRLPAGPRSAAELEATSSNRTSIEAIARGISPVIADFKKLNLTVPSRNQVARFY